MRLRVALIVAAIAALSVGAPTAAPATAKVNGCALFASSLNFYWKHNLPVHTYGVIGHSQRCEYASKPAPGSVTSSFLVVLYFGQARSSSTAHVTFGGFLLAARKSGKPFVRLRGIGADEAWAVELRSEGANVTQAYWRKGRFLGWLSVAGPGLHGDIDDAKDLLKPFLRRLH